MNLIPKNWENFQHYRDRNPLWIKLHKNLLDDRKFQSLPVSALCDTREEREALKKKFVRAREKQNILRVNPYSDVGRSTNSDKTNRIRKASV